MTISIRNAEAEQLARELARNSGKNLTEVVLEALRDYRAEQNQKDEVGQDLAERLLSIGAHCAGLPDLDDRSAEEIIGYDEHGLPS